MLATCAARSLLTTVPHAGAQTTLAASPRPHRSPSCPVLLPPSTPRVPRMGPEEAAIGDKQAAGLIYIKGGGFVTGDGDEATSLAALTEEARSLGRSCSSVPLQFSRLTDGHHLQVGAGIWVAGPPPRIRPGHRLHGRLRPSQAALHLLLSCRNRRFHLLPPRIKNTRLAATHA